MPLRDRPVTVGMIGTNPYLYNDDKKNVLFNEKGKSLSTLTPNDCQTLKKGLTRGQCYKTFSSVIYKFL